MQVWLDVVPEGPGWVVRLDEVDLGRYCSQLQAFHAAVVKARQMTRSGQQAQVRVLREYDWPEEPRLRMY